MSMCILVIMCSFVSNGTLGLFDGCDERLSLGSSCFCSSPASY